MPYQYPSYDYRGQQERRNENMQWTMRLIVLCLFFIIGIMAHQLTEANAKIEALSIVTLVEETGLVEGLDWLPGPTLASAPREHEHMKYTE